MAVFRWISVVHPSLLGKNIQKGPKNKQSWSLHIGEHFSIQLSLRIASRSSKIERDIQFISARLVWDCRSNLDASCISGLFAEHTKLTGLTVTTGLFPLCTRLWNAFCITLCIENYNPDLPDFEPSKNVCPLTKLPITIGTLQRCDVQRLWDSTWVFHMGMKLISDSNGWLLQPFEDIFSCLTQMKAMSPCIVYTNVWVRGTFFKTDSVQIQMKQRVYFYLKFD